MRYELTDYKWAAIKGRFLRDTALKTRHEHGNTGSKCPVRTNQSGLSGC